MVLSEIWHNRKVGVETLLNSIKFFYSHLTLLLVSLIPSTIRAIQMLHEDTPVLLEGVVFITRIFLFIIIIIIMTKSNLHELRNKSFWDKITNSSANEFKKNWPYGFLAQIIVFVVFLFGIGNLLIVLFSHLFVEIISFPSFDTDAVYNASVYFLKNMSVIPLTMVYIIYICGLKPNKK